MKLAMKLTACLILLTNLLNISHANLFTISEQKINQYLTLNLVAPNQPPKRMGVERLFSFEYQIQNLTTQIGRTAEKKVEVNTTVIGTLNLTGKIYPIQLQLQFDTVPYFDAEKGALYLKQIRIINWIVSPEKYTNEMNTFMPLIAENIDHILAYYPVYILDANQPKEALLKRFAHAILVQEGALALEISPF